jgi:crotonobetainyl-CoA:carnitine CoA-transferase CaiB-like acyl-CoA transferase
LPDFRRGAQAIYGCGGASRPGGKPIMRPLEGLFVLDFTTLLPGPMATLLLAEAGAEVVKVERPGQGEDMRAYSPSWGRDSAYFALLNRGKKSIAVDLKSPQARAELAPLIARADVLVEQFRPGVMERMGLGYADVGALNPKAIYCSISGYGQNGPSRDRAGHDLNYIGDAGLLALSMGPSDAPVAPPALIADIAGGAYPAVINILMALRERDATGRGRRLDIAMTDNLFPFMFWALGDGLAGGVWRGNGDHLLTGGGARYRLYPCADGRILAAAPLEDKFWSEFCDLIGLEEPYRARSFDPATIARAAALVRAQPSAHWRERIAGRDCCCSVVASLREALGDPHFAARGLMAHRLVNEAGDEMPALPVPLDPAFRGAADAALSAPALGADNGALGIGSPAAARVDGARNS